MASFLARALELSPRVSPFRDVPQTHPHARDIGAIAAAGVTRGCNPPANDRYCPDDAVTRAQMAVFLARVLESR